MKTKILRIALWIAVVLWMAVIFAFSAESGKASTETSDGFVDRVVEEIFGTSDRDTVPDPIRLKISFLVRKAAHFTAFMLLGVLTASALRVDLKLFWLHAGVSLGICVLYAVSDEVHQLFVPGREGRLLDVGIDTAGALCGILLFCAVFAAVKLVRGRRKENLR